MDGLFNLAKMLFEIVIEPADGLAPVIYFTFFLLFILVAALTQKMASYSNL